MYLHFLYFFKKKKKKPWDVGISKRGVNFGATADSIDMGPKEDGFRSQMLAKYGH